MTLENAKAKFINVSKKILKTDLSTVPSTLIAYKEEIISAYITFVKYCTDLYKLELTTDQKTELTEYQNYIANKFEQCLVRLNCKFDLSENLLDLPDQSTIKIIGIEIETIKESIMAENASFVRLCASTLNSVYKGDPLELQSFVNSVELLKELSEAGQANILFKFVKSKLAGKALEQIKSTDLTTDLILASLKANIKPESSKVIEGRFTALRQSRHSAEDFSKKVEALAESFRRSLISEGFPETKANDMTVEKTVTLCRDVAQSDITKSVLSASTFQTAQDVVAKFLTENDKTVTEKSVLTYNSSFQKNKKPFYGQKGSNRDHNSFQTRNSNQNYSQNRTNFNRGTGNNYRRPNGNRNWNQNRNNRNGHWNNNRDNRNVRITHAENSSVPQESLGNTERGIHDFNQQLQS